ncbi:MAG TPA: hypothetical protein ENK18_17580 [Deltaproteobacteria bacterium]|nr:hypothetical protein [Deltaproteobacteria bacterium]
MRSIWLCCGLASCAPGSLWIEEGGEVPDPTGSGFVTSPWEQPSDTAALDPALYEGAYARIVSPAAAAVLSWHEPTRFEVEVRSAVGEVLPAGPVQWIASDDPDFEGNGEASFVDDTLELGTHEIMAIAHLPGGSTAAHSVGDVRVQSGYAGTYAGLFSVDGTVTQITITCTGAAVLVVGQQGVLGEGDGDCLVSILGIDVPMSWDFALENLDGVVSGDAGVDLIGFFSYRVPATGTLDPQGDGFDVTFEADIPLIGTISAFLSAPRISLET